MTENQKIERKRIIETASIINVLSFDYIPSLFQLIGYRKRVAEQILTESDQENLIHLNLLFDEVQEKIKRLIGIEQEA